LLDALRIETAILGDCYWGSFGQQIVFREDVERIDKLKEDGSSRPDEPLKRKARRKQSFYARSLRDSARLVLADCEYLPHVFDATLSLIPMEPNQLTTVSKRLAR
jgi:hypothetical protein